MNNLPPWLIATLRICMGWLFAWNGWLHISDKDWSAISYIQRTNTFESLYAWFTKPDIFEWVHFLNSWGILVLGVCLIIGFSTRLASIFGIIAVTLYYIPLIGKFPFLTNGSLFISEHIFYILILLALIFLNAGQYFGFGKKLIVRVAESE